MQKRLPAYPVSSCKAAARSAVVLRLQRQLMAQEAVKDSPYPSKAGREMMNNSLQRSTLAFLDGERERQASSQTAPLVLLPSKRPMQALALFAHQLGT